MYYFVDGCGDFMHYRDLISLCQDLEAADIDSKVRIIDSAGYFYETVTRHQRIVDAIKIEASSGDCNFVVDAAKKYFNEDLVEFSDVLEKLDALFIKAREFDE